MDREVAGEPPPIDNTLDASGGYDNFMLDNTPYVNARVRTTAQGPNSIGSPMRVAVYKMRHSVTLRTERNTGAS